MTVAADAPRQSGWTPPAPASVRNYPMNCWWVAAFAAEVGEALIGRWLLDTPVLLYRTAAGQVAAIEDRCPHRSAPLSVGKRVGDSVQCGYHGFTFGPDGRCERIPSQAIAPSTVRIRSFPVVENGPFVWIYLGDPDALGGTPPAPALDWYGDAAFATVQDRMDIAANYMLLKENVLDLTHFGYVHAATFGITDWVDPPEVSVQGDVVTYHQSFTASPLPPVFAEPLGLRPGTPADRENYGSFVSPALQVAAVDVYDPAGRGPEPIGRFRIVHATTPIDADHMHYFWVLGRDYGTTPESMQALADITRVGFAEDEAMIEAVQRLVSRDLRGAAAPEVSVRADQAGVQARRALRRWMERETT
jgi:vanillate O-demethylase monooxygenase subunit